MINRLRLVLLVSLVMVLLAACGSPSTADEAAADDNAMYAETDEEMAGDGAEADEEPTPAPTVAPTPTPAAPALAEGPAKELYAIGDTARVGPFLVRVESVKAAMESELGSTPMEGHRFVLVEITLQNTSSEAQEVAALLQMGLEDATGQEYPVDPSVAMDVLTLQGTIEAGAIRSGTLGYQVPVDARNLRWFFRTIEGDQTNALKETGRAVFDTQL